MEKYPQSFPWIMKFSLLWELLPFYGHLPLWRYLLCNLSAQTKQVWVKNQQAFRERGKNMKMNIIKYKVAFDEQFKNYLANPEVLLNNKISVILYSTQEWINLFGEFLTNCLKENKWPIFEDIEIPEWMSVSYFLEPLYNTLKQMDENQESVIAKNWKILSTRYSNKDYLTNIEAKELIDSDYAK